MLLDAFHLCADQRVVCFNDPIKFYCLVSLMDPLNFVVTMLEDGKQNVCTWKISYTSNSSLQPIYHMLMITGNFEES